jgi:hypothetical protein
MKEMVVLPLDQTDVLPATLQGLTASQLNRLALTIQKDTHIIFPANCDQSHSICMEVDVALGVIKVYDSCGLVSNCFNVKLLSYLHSFIASLNCNI